MLRCCVGLNVVDYKQPAAPSMMTLIAAVVITRRDIFIVILLYGPLGSPRSDDSLTTINDVVQVASNWCLYKMLQGLRIAA